MKTKKKKRAALEIALTVTVAAGRGGAKNAIPLILKESYHAALALLDELDQNDEKHQPEESEDQG